MVSKQEIQDWIFNTLSTPTPIFNNLPACPYAKKAWLDGKVEIVDKDWQTFDFSLLLTGKYDLYIIPCNSNLEVEAFDHLVEQVREHVGNQYIVLDDHPEHKEQVKEIDLNFGKCPLIFVQSREKLQEARKFLESKDYYKNWDPEYKNEVTEL
jgi:hypothetical protein